jgi:2-polyprenyl-3-methyl-5-hydroxy-6-metoxy-1,4-benzoquinol methylase
MSNIKTSLKEDSGPDNNANPFQYQTVEDQKRAEFIRSAIEAHHPGKSCQILEVGCGNGHICASLAGHGHQVLGVDLDGASIAWAQSNYDLPHLRFEQIAAEDLDYEAHFDAIVCSEVLEHLEEPARILRYGFKHLKQEGLFVTTVPNGYGPREILMTQPMQYLEKKGLGQTLNRVKRSMGFGHGTAQSQNPDLTHIQFFSRRKITELHRSAGFELKDFAKSDAFRNVFPYSLLTRRIRALEKLDCRAADHLPPALCSGFYMSFIKAAGA